MPDKGPSILCLRCDKRSYNLGDVEHRFCAFCGVFHETDATYEIGETRDARLAAIEAVLTSTFEGTELDQARKGMVTFADNFHDALKRAFDTMPTAGFADFVVRVGRLVIHLEAQARALEQEQGVKIDMAQTSYTTAVLELTTTAFTEIQTKLLAAGYEHAIMSNGEIDMTGIAVRRKGSSHVAKEEGEQTP